MAWTDDRVETLKRMWGEGASASQIAKELGGVTRNAVIGKVHRLGLSNRNADEAKPASQTPAKPAPAPKTAKPDPTPAPKPEPVAAVEEDDDDEPRTMAAVPQGTNVTPLRKPLMAGQPLPPQPSANEISPEALAKVNAVEKTAKKISLMELTERTCKWPIGDPATEKFWFCGLQTQAGKPYCEAHVSVAFQPMSSRRDRKR
ncbi:MAG: GcrA family cell cycle regulator [Jannaschia helgolandensis]|jgi:GcrA cell cycle regulator|uniref:GcrA cell cycle regulator n=1 Tax=Jannaschia helgolandensis TaxID=188906 RepID=A0A1H7IZJ6_9RHOB|nr:GcrA family cell cycle regulator [Jannaschia helgolandensis]SEK67796.1 GcrA cell cycle regulator [Jannaschia helgolandensis]|tara:strand:+ start:2014 stop:2619 length:606 start_codon:yes stop_codon:yes gene_type:complete